MVQEKRFAVLIDADNVSAKYIKYILDEITNYGEATYKRIYGDWTKPNTSSWKDVLLENSVTPIQQYGYTVGKNATDSAMIIDAMDILYSGNVDGFCIVSSDSDFTKLSSRLRESGMFVVGMGEKKTPKPFIASCNQFKYLDVLAESENKIAADSIQVKNNQNKTESGMGTEDKNTKLSKNDNSKAMTDLNTIKMAIIKMVNENDDEEQSMNIGELGSRLVKRYPDFDVRNYGDTKLSRFLKKFDFLEMHTKGDEGTSLWVSLKNNLTEQEIVEKAVQKPKKRIYKKKPKVEK
ncbi:MAG: NYN domain-containing protein [Sedimentibacter sp.]|uniref:NYN domain-containing protein n=1 Tax=Sedimentibacter sp. TaxID=1960295 RepID=UPI002982393A|nr:NYN domain-containing protein [Sedimentibacter sp.]MDW5298574.1 NYN domain-containing protein [Sedimentibacter sp.]